VTDNELKLQGEISSLWNILEADQIKKLTQAKTQIRIGDRFAGVGIDSSGARHVLMPCPPGHDTLGLWKSAGIVLDRRNLAGTEGVSGTWLVLSCLRSGLHDVFLRLAANVLHCLPSDEREVLSVCMTTLDAWRSLLGPLQRPTLGPNEVVGLIGELLVLQKLARVNPILALAAWEGPLGGQHDFRYGMRAIEAKATAARVGRFITIHGPSQLEAPVGGTLHLSWSRLESVPGGTLQLPKLVLSLQNAGIDRERLSGILARMGYDEAAEQPATMATYELVEWLVWKVGVNFPRVVPASFVSGAIPSSVINLNYTIDLSGSEPAPVTSGEQEHVWTNLLSVQSEQEQGRKVNRSQEKDGCPPR
jgi:hypothetical protein